MSEQQRASVHQTQRRAVNERLMMTRPNHGQPICVLSGLGKDLGNRQSALTILFKLERRGHQSRARGGHELKLQSLSGKTGWDRLPAQPVEFRLGIERIDLTRPALHEQRDHSFGSWLEMRST